MNSTDYYQVVVRRIDLNGERMTIAAKPGMVSWEEVASASNLLAVSANIEPGMRVLLLEGGCGALAVWAARRGAEVHYYNHSLIGMEMAQRTLTENQVMGVELYKAAVPDERFGDYFDIALLVIPKGRAFTRLLLAAACRTLKPGGYLYLAGPNEGGAKSMIKDAGELFGQAVTLGTKARSRVGVAMKREGYKLPHNWDVTIQTFEAHGLRVFSLPGVFSAGELDTGTAMLLETLDEPTCAGKRVLDVACGYGMIGLYAAQLGASQIDMVDVNWLALACAEQGVIANGFSDQCRVIASDLYAALDDSRYDLILSNPPFHAGHSVDTQAAQALVAGAWERLAQGGVLRIVANRFLPYHRLLETVFGERNWSVVREDRRYRVLEGRK